MKCVLILSFFAFFYESFCSKTTIGQVTRILTRDSGKYQVESAGILTGEPSSQDLCENTTKASEVTSMLTEEPSQNDTIAPVKDEVYFKLEAECLSGNYQEFLGLLRESARLGRPLALSDLLSQAVSDGNVQIALAILAYPGLCPLNDDDWHILEMACRNGAVHVVQALLRKDQIDPSLLDNEALVSAMQAKQMPCVHALLRNPRVTSHPSFESIVFSAIEQKNLSQFMMLFQLSRAIPANMALSMACQVGFEKAAVFLFHHVDMHIGAEYMECLHFCLKRDDKKMVKMLFEGYEPKVWPENVRIPTIVLDPEGLVTAFLASEYAKESRIYRLLLLLFKMNLIDLVKLVLVHPNAYPALRRLLEDPATKGYGEACINLAFESFFEIDT